MADFDDVLMMKSPERWPNIVLPLKKSNGLGFSQCGLLIGDGKPIVHVTNMWAPNPNCEKIEYADFEAIVKDGWRVD